MYGGPIHNTAGINLQATLSAASAGAMTNPEPHHPITCTGALSMDFERGLACEHARVGPDDERLHYALDHTIALLLMECVCDWFWNGKPLPPLSIPGPTAPTSPENKSHSAS